MNYQQAYEGIMKSAFVLDTPGPTPANTNVLNYTNFVSDSFPTDADLEIDEPIVLISKRRDLAKI
jgi:microcystin degradation protein MlrC